MHSTVGNSSTNTAASDDDKVTSLVAAMTLDEKALLTSGLGMWATHPIERLGIPSWRLTDGPNGARGTRFGPAGVRAICVPSGAALAASWNTDLVEEVGALLGRETRARGARALLGPTINIQRSPLGGRTFECFSEDPCLTGAMAAAYVRGVQSEGVIATAKHFAGNEAEFDRHMINTSVDERTLREIYLAPFETAVKEADVLGIMSAYNRLNGAFCADHAWLLRDVLREEWGFSGIVMTDWWALADTETAAEAGLDLEMPGPGRAFGSALADAVREGRVDEALLDEKVARLLRVMARLGAMVDPAAPPEEHATDDCGPAIARRAAQEAMVLFRNRDGILPLSAANVRKVAIVGPNASRAQIMGGGSATLRPQHLTSPRKALEDALREQGVEVVYAQGCAASEGFALLESGNLIAKDGQPGLTVRFHGGQDATGPVLCEVRSDNADLTFMGEPAPGVPAEGFCLRASGHFMPAVSGTHRFRFASNWGGRVNMAGAERASLEPDPSIAPLEKASAEFSCDLVAGQPVDLCIDFAGATQERFCQLSLACQPPALDDGLDQAVQAARDADIVLAIVGTDPTVESEGFDRSSLDLPGRQNELLARVIAANPATVVVVNSGSPVTMPWLDDAAAVLQCWFGGQEMSGALADVLLGRAEPGGRAPISFPERIEDTAAFGNFPGAAGEVRYGEGIFVGYRWHDARLLPAAVPFGHGLGYSTFDWKSAVSATKIIAGDTLSVTVQATNTGDRSGSDVVQVYVAPPAGALPRAPQELRGFAKLRAGPGASAEAKIELGPRAFAHWHPGDRDAERLASRLSATPFAPPRIRRQPLQGWTIDPGGYRIIVARSSADPVETFEIEIVDAEAVEQS